LVVRKSLSIKYAVANKRRMSYVPPPPFTNTVRFVPGEPFAPPYESREDVVYPRISDRPDPAYNTEHVQSGYDSAVEQQLYVVDRTQQVYNSSGQRNFTEAEDSDRGENDAGRQGKKKSGVGVNLKTPEILGVGASVNISAAPLSAISKNIHRIMPYPHSGPTAPVDPNDLDVCVQEELIATSFYKIDVPIMTITMFICSSLSFITSIFYASSGACNNASPFLYASFIFTFASMGGGISGGSLYVRARIMSVAGMGPGLGKKIIQIFKTSTLNRITTCLWGYASAYASITTILRWDSGGNELESCPNAYLDVIAASAIIYNAVSAVLLVYHGIHLLQEYVQKVREDKLLNVRN
jgi:hypothetical protein